jgi:hypothetical protein
MGVIGSEQCVAVEDPLVFAGSCDRRDDRRVPLRIMKRLVDQTIDDVHGILGTRTAGDRVTWVRDVFARIGGDSRELKAVAVWNPTTENGVNRSNGGEWLQWEPAVY